jgi:coatomer protein complex subunit gamma
VRSAGAKAAAAGKAAAAAAAAAAALAAVPELAALGAPLATGAPVALTEDDTEYAVAVVKHVFPAALLLAFTVTNTVAEQVLDDVRVEVDVGGSPFTITSTLPAPHLPPNSPSPVFVLLARPPAPALPAASLRAGLRFRVRELDPSTGEPEDGGYDDEYALEDVPVSTADYVVAEPLADWSAAWDAAGGEREATDTYDLGPRDSLQAAADAVVASLGLAPCAGSDAVPPNARSHAVLLAGRVAGVPGRVLARVALGATPGGGVAMQVAARGTEAGEAAEAVHAVVQEG